MLPLCATFHYFDPRYYYYPGSKENTTSFVPASEERTRVCKDAGLVLPFLPSTLTRQSEKNEIGSLFTLESIHYKPSL